MSQRVNLANEILIYMAFRSREMILPLDASLVSPHLELQFCVATLGRPEGNGEQAEVSKQGGRGMTGGGMLREAG